MGKTGPALQAKLGSRVRVIRGEDWKMKVSELEGAQLDYWVAKAGEEKAMIMTNFIPHRCLVSDEMVSALMSDFSPSSNWDQGGPIIQRERIELLWAGEWLGKVAGKINASEDGPTPLIAAMRAYVKSKFGDEVTDETTNKGIQIPKTGS